ncbi:SDR family NAD(P)-dependent oxidoreductase [Tersicoccus sp. Bi-70]|uniref:SDR family NAD(P)-dependent oxidoreductase n=1 Tax=Tersicoccus sp. Bi-70 TaxID=1897634 RepID=UPI0009774551|nr:SDR family oxidoreductase [Tersicoccus sp. Bi-70]OMH35017.1 short-chain dehydrogenase [Tersicoccus sp. Bi-70]
MNRHVLVTGAARGIGEAVARAFHAAGDDLTLVDARAEDLDAVASELEAVATVQDLADPDGTERMIVAADERRPIDVLVNAAGIYPTTPFATLDAATFERVQRINVTAPLTATLALARRATAAGRRPCVVNITSGAALRARPGALPYSTSKAALEMVTRASALELGPAGIRVNAVSPGYVKVDSPVSRVSDEYEQAVSPNPLGVIGRPEEIAKAVLWLADPEQTGWITGHILRVDGGASTGAHTLPLSWTGTAS